MLAEQPWLDGQGDEPSLADKLAAQPLGGAIGGEPHISRQRKHFTNKRDVKLLKLPKGAAACHQTRYPNQWGVPRARPPGLDGPKGPTQYESAVIDHIESLLNLDLAETVAADDHAIHSLLCSVFPQYKPSDLDPRYCLNLKAANVPVKETAAKRLYPTGTQTMKSVLQPNDVCSLLDAEKGYHQVALDPASAAMQRFPIQLRLLNAALKKLGRPPIIVAATSTLLIDGEICVIMQPKVVMFGSTLSRSQFEDRLQITLNYIRVLGGIRAVTQVDDIAILNSRGPTAGYADTVLAITVFSFFGWHLHLKGPKAKDVWPRSIFQFDGRVWQPETLNFYSPPETDLRHRQYLSQTLARRERYRPLQQCLVA